MIEELRPIDQEDEIIVQLQKVNSEFYHAFENLSIDSTAIDHLASVCSGVVELCTPVVEFIISKEFIIFWTTGK